MEQGFLVWYREGKHTSLINNLYIILQKPTKIAQEMKLCTCYFIKKKLYHIAYYGISQPNREFQCVKAEHISNSQLIDHSTEVKQIYNFSFTVMHLLFIL